MKLCIITNIMTPYRVPLFARLAQRCDDFTVLLMAEQEENRQWQIGPVPFKSEVLPGRHLRPYGAEVSLHFNYGVVRRLRRMNPDVVLSGGFAPAHLVAFVYCKLFRKRYVQWGEFTLRDGAQASPIRRVLRRIMIRGADACVASSSEAREAFLYYGACSRSVHTALMPVEVERIHHEVAAIKRTAEHADRRRNYPGPVLLSVGRLLDAKGCRQLFDLYGQIQATRSDVSLVCVGDGPDRAAYESLCRERGWERVHFIGHMQPASLSRYLALGDLFVFPTLSDTFGAVLSEAMAAGLPALSSIHAAATRDLVRDGVNGWAYDPHDPDQGAALVLKFLGMSHSEQKAVGLAAYQSVRPTDVTPAADDMARFLESVAAIRASWGTVNDQARGPEGGSGLERRPILIVGPTPPPYHGVAMAIKTLLDSRLTQSFAVVHLELADRRGIGHVNKPDLHDVVLFIRQWLRLLRLLIRYQPQIMYFVLSQSTIGVLRDSLFVWPARLFGAKVMAHLHGGGFRNWYSGRWLPMRLYARWLMRTVDRTIVLGESLRGQFDGLVASERIAVVPNGIEDIGIGSPQLASPQRRWQVLYLNTLNKMKGAMVMLEAVALVARQRTDVEFVFAGPWSHDEHRREADAHIASHQLAAFITFTGQVAGEEKRALLHSADLFVFPGIQQEGQPLVVLEAMAAGLPILFTNRGCLGETLRDGESGIEVPADDAGALAVQIQRLLSRPDEMRRFGANARIKFEQEYMLDRHLDRMITLFEEVAASPGSCNRAPVVEVVKREASL
jgi:glycosyltransferase involved in cell wall biosynthesis